MTVRLVQCVRGDRVKIVKLDTGKGATLNLMSLGLDIGDTIELLQRSPLRGPVIVRRDGTSVAIGYRLAEKILVEKD